MTGIDGAELRGEGAQSQGEDLIFALDIGTRKVAGLLVQATAKGDMELLAAEVVEHQSRAMHDGQIHDVTSVAELIRLVADRLEERCQVKLKKAAVAAAGRALRTQVGTASVRVSTLNRITENDVLALELEAIVSAQRSLSREMAAPTSLGERHFCVGYSVKGYELDGSPIGSLIGQRGEVISASTIATFLPRVVVDSLCSAVEAAGLEIASMTLEPIAAIAVAIPPTMRQLNLALVDVGAGTSDVAITANGEVIAYGMVPFAGDEITEELCQAFLLDFHEGERVKRLIGSGMSIEYTDVLGMQGVLDQDEVIAAIDSRVNQLAQDITDKILELNGSEPQAVICIGGGSLTPGLPGRLASRLGLSPGRVAVRGPEIVRSVTRVAGALEGPMAITPLGIAVTARHRNSLAFFSVKVNGLTARLMHIGTPTVADALIASGVGIRQLHAKPGPGMTIEVNGEVRVIKGSAGQPARFLVNGESASLDTEIREGDEIELTPPIDGQPPSVTAGDLVDCRETAFVFRGQQHSILPTVTRDDETIPLTAKLNDNDRIVVTCDRSIATVVEQLIGEDDEAFRCISYTLNGRACSAQISHRRYTVNGVSVSGDYRVCSGDVIDVETCEIPLTVSDVFTKGRDEVSKEVKVLLNGREIVLYDGRSAVEVCVNGEPSSLSHHISDGDVISVEVPKPPSFILAELLEHLDLGDTIGQLRASGRGTVKLTVNGRPADFSTGIENGDAVEISID